MWCVSERCSPKLQFSKALKHMLKLSIYLNSIVFKVKCVRKCSRESRSSPECESQEPNPEHIDVNGPKVFMHVSRKKMANYPGKWKAYIPLFLVTSRTFALSPQS